MVESSESRIIAIPIKGNARIRELGGELCNFLTGFDVDMQSFNRSSYLVLGRFADGNKRGNIAFVFVRKSNAVIQFFAESEFRSDLRTYELALRTWKQYFTAR